ncbi:MAG: DUF167 domain-containing protein [Candidatus Bruticola sp.]
MSVLGVSESAEGCVLTVKVVPRAGSNALCAPKDGADGTWQVRLTAPAVDGKANSALIDFLAKCFKLRRRQIRIKLGEKSRHKLIILEGLSISQAYEILQNFSS